MRGLLAVSLLMVACTEAPVSGGDPEKCGNHRLDSGETCDDGNDINDDACTNACQRAACGDGIVRMDLAEGTVGFEACDDANDDDEDACTSGCAVAVCGDGILRSDLAEGAEGFEA